MQNPVTPGDSKFNHAGHMARGTVLGFLGSAVSLPTGLLTAAFLTRKLGPENYGVLTVTATLIVWAEVVLTAGFNRAAIKFISESKNHEPISTKFLQAQALLGIISAGLVITLAPVIAAWLNTPEMTVYIRAYALSIPITAVSSIHIAILIGLGHYGQRAILTAIFWIFRLFLILWFVGCNPTVTAVIWANIAASGLVLLWARVYVQPSLFSRSDFPIKNIWDYGWPMFLFTIGMNIFGQLDLFFVKAMCTPPETAGYYSAAKNLTILPALFTASFTPLLLGKLAILSREDQHQSARDISQKSIHFMICLLPFAAMASGSSEEIVLLVYGKAFLPTSRILAILIFAALGIAVIAVTSSTLVAAGRPVLNLMAVFPILGLSIACLIIWLPRFGANGAALIISVLAWTGALINAIIVSKIWNLKLSIWLALRSVLVCLAIFTLAGAWKAGGMLLFVKLGVLTFLTMVFYLLTGVIKLRDLQLIRIALKP
jgi:O-antigen/teichoic acid export membrane protein